MSSLALDATGRRRKGFNLRKENEGRPSLKSRIAAFEAARTDRSILWIAANGRIVCAEHGPYPGTDTWIADDYERLSLADKHYLADRRGKRPECETCESASRSAEAGR